MIHKVKDDVLGPVQPQESPWERQVNDDVKPCGFDLLLHGHLHDGFRIWESRFQSPAYLDSEHLPPQGTWPFNVPRWDGSDPKGTTILLWAEQGFGDNIQFIRYAPRVADLGAAVLLACPPALQRLFTNVRGVSKVCESLADLSSAKYDVHASLLSLPYLFGTSLATIPASVPYLTAQSAWPVDRERFNVGLVWAGNPQQTEDTTRSMSLSYLLPVLTQPGVNWFSLQVGQAVEQLYQGQVYGLIHDLSPRLTDFADTASVISQLDLVITVDTAVAHLAGALGKPVWVMLPYTADWRWFLNRTDSPWYPTATLFRQPVPGDWFSVVLAMQERLQGVLLRRAGAMMALTSTSAESPCAPALLYASSARR